MSRKQLSYEDALDFEEPADLSQLTLVFSLTQLSALETASVLRFLEGEESSSEYFDSAVKKMRAVAKTMRYHTKHDR